MVDPKRAREVVDAYLRTAREEDLDGWLDLFAEDATLEDPVGSGVHEGKDAIRAFRDKTMGRTEDFTNELKQLRIAGNSVAFLFELRFTWKGEARRVSPIDVIELNDDGLIA